MQKWEKITEQHIDNMGIKSIIRRIGQNIEWEAIKQDLTVTTVIDPTTNEIRQILNSRLLTDYELNMEEYR